MPFAYPGMPTQKQLVLPVIRAVSELGGSAAARDITGHVIENFPAAECLLQIKYPNRPETSVLIDRAERARSTAKLLGVLERPSRGMYVITDLGKRLLTKPERDAHDQIRKLDKRYRRQKRKEKSKGPNQTSLTGLTGTNQVLAGAAGGGLDAANFAGFTSPLADWSIADTAREVLGSPGFSATMGSLSGLAGISQALAEGVGGVLGSPSFSGALSAVAGLGGTDWSAMTGAGGVLDAANFAGFTSPLADWSGVGAIRESLGSPGFAAGIGSFTGLTGTNQVLAGAAGGVLGSPSISGALSAAAGISSEPLEGISFINDSVTKLWDIFRPDSVNAAVEMALSSPNFNRVVEAFFEENREEITHLLTGEGTSQPEAGTLAKLPEARGSVRQFDDLRDSPTSVKYGFAVALIVYLGWFFSFMISAAPNPSVDQIVQAVVANGGFIGTTWGLAHTQKEGKVKKTGEAR